MKTNYLSIPVPVVAHQFFDTFTDASQFKFSTYIEYNVNVGFRLISKYGSTLISNSDWIVEFPNGELHVVTDERFKQRFKESATFNPDEVTNAITMARLSKDLGDCA